MITIDENLKNHVEIISENRIKVLDSINQNELILFLENIIDDKNILLDLKDLDKDKKCIALKYAMEHDDKYNLLLTLNLFNLLKTYNNLDESFFSSRDIYFNDTVELVDIKIALDADIKQFLKQFGIYFLSIIKCCNKLTYSPLETVKTLPILYQKLFSIMDFSTAAGIFSRAPEINTNECLLIDDSYKYLNLMLLKSNLAINFLADFYDEGIKNGN